MTRQYRVFDTGPLSCFANAGVLGLLKLLSVEYTSILVEPVAVEIRNGIRVRPMLQPVLDAEWLTPADLTAPAELSAFKKVGQRLVGTSGRNIGETAAIAWAMAHPGSEVVLDDGAARKAADYFKVQKTGSLGLLVRALKESQIDETLANGIVDELITNGGARLPCGPGEFVAWAKRQGALD